MSGLWTPPPRSSEARALYAAAEADRAARPERYTLDSETLLARALGDDNAGALGDEDWREGFARYLASAAEDGRLNALGTRMVADSAVISAANGEISPSASAAFLRPAQIILKP